MTPDPPQLQALLAHRRWVQDLARRLVRDPGVAEDVAQEAILAALRTPQARPRALRAWLGAVVRNLVWERMRGEDRRLAREHRVASRETVPSTLDLVEAVGAHREVVDALMALPEHYRDVLVRRYYEGETPTEIADRQGTPVATVKTRLQRGLALLRQRLDELHGGDGRRWMSALGPLIAPSARPAPVPAAALTLKWVALLVALALPAGLWWWSRLAAEPRPAERSVAAPGALAAVDDVPPRLDPPATADRLPSGPVSDLSFTARRAAREASFQGLRGDVRGRVLGLDGGPVGGVVVRFDDDGMATQPGRGAAVQVTGDDGSFELRGVRSSGLVLAVAEGLVTVAAGRVDGLAPASGVTVVVAPARTLDGRVVGDHDLPLAGALVRLDLPQDLLDPLGPHAAHAAPLAFQTPGDVDGGFRMTVPRVAGLGLEVERSGYATRRLEVDALPPGSLWVTLERPSWSGASVSGWVLGPDGAPVPEARVAGGGRVTSTDPAGHFRLPAEGVDELVACAAGLGARRLPRGQAWPERVEITLPPAPSVIEGRVVDPGGQGLSGIGVWIADPTVLDPGRTEREEGQEVERFGVHPREFRAGRPPLLLEAFLAGEPERIWRPAETDREGRFRIEGLGTRAYTVVAGDPYTLIRARRSGVEPGEGVELVLDPAALGAPLRGRVVDRLGRPVSGVRVFRGTQVLDLEHDGRRIWGEGRLVGGPITRGDGTFEVEDLAREGAYLRLEGEGIVPRLWGLEPDQPLEGEVDLVVELRAYLRVNAGAGEVGAAAAVLDAEGRELELLRWEGARRLRSRTTSLAAFGDGSRSPTLLVAPDAAWVELRPRDGEARRLPLELRRGELLDVHF